MLQRLQTLTKIRQGEWHLVVPLVFMLLLNTAVYELSDVVATAGFISTLGTEQFLWLWPISMVITLFATGGYALIVDKVPRIKLLHWLLLAFGSLYVLVFGLFALGAPAWLTYPLLMILGEQQIAVFPLAFWALASDVYSTADAKRLFPILAAGAAFGSLIGNILAGSLAIWFKNNPNHRSWEALLICAVLCFVAWNIVHFAFRKREIRARQSKQIHDSMRETFKVGADVIRNVPLFSLLAIVLFATGITFTIIEFHFLLSLDTIAATDPLNFQRLYGFYKVALVLMLMTFQWFIASRWLGKVHPKVGFVILPLVLLAATLGMLIQPILGGVVGRFVARITQGGWDEPLRKSVQSIVPDERRGRVSVFLDTYCYSLATIIGCGLLSLTMSGAWFGWLSAATSTTIYSILGIVAALAGVWAAWRIRTVYDKSLLNWRLSRTRRRSVLDGIEF